MSSALDDAVSIVDFESMSDRAQTRELRRLAKAFYAQPDTTTIPPLFVLEAFNSAFKDVLAKQFHTLFGAQKDTARANEWNELVGKAVSKARAVIGSKLKEKKITNAMDAETLSTLRSFELRLFYIYKTGLLDCFRVSQPALFGTVWPPLTEALLSEIICLLVPSARMLEWKTMLNLVSVTIMQHDSNTDILQIAGVVEFRAHDDCSTVSPLALLLNNTLTRRNIPSRHDPLIRLEVQRDFAVIFIESLHRGFIDGVDWLAMTPPTSKLPPGKGHRMLEATDFAGQYGLNSDQLQAWNGVIHNVLKSNIMDPVVRATRTTKSATGMTAILGLSDLDVTKALKPHDLLHLWQCVPAMLEASSSTWYYITKSSTRRGLQVQSVANTINTALAWLPTLSKLRERPLVAEVFQRFLAVCSETSDMDTEYGAAWDGFEYPGEDVCDGLSEEVIETDKSIRNDFFVFWRALENLDSVLSTVLPTIKNEESVDCWDEESVAARNALIQVCFILFFCQVLTEES